MNNFKVKKYFSKFVFVLFSFLFILQSSFARDVTELEVEKKDSWQEKFDINSKKGKYNVLVTATDLGGNKTVEGPFNIYVDPNSDLPVCQITNPVSMMRVPGNLNVVGTCVDDDAVEYVELILDGDQNNPVRANGKEFWSYFIKTESLNEGLHTIDVYGVDINGVKGEATSVSWCLDRQQPVIEVTNVGIGTIVSGNVAFEGIVSDGNGIKSMAYSLDAGKEFFDVKVANDKKTNSSEFKFSIDTKKLTDGPAVIWFKATDMQGSVGYYSFLCFIDNTNPEVNIVSPVDKAIENGVFTVVGSAKDAIGIKSLSWEFNGQTGDFEIVPGNNYWAKEFTSKEVLKSGKFIITAVDTAGNITKQERAITINSELDKPSVKIQWPIAGANLKNGDYYIRGIATDDDGVQSVTVFIDGNKVKTVTTNGVFDVEIDELKYKTRGTHSVSVVATDKYGVVGNESYVEYLSNGQKPSFSIPMLVGGSDSGEAVFGKLVNPEGGSVFKIDSESASGIKSASYSIQWSSDKLGLAPENKTEVKVIDIATPVQRVPFSIPIESLPWGVVHLNFKVVDTFERESVYSTCLHVKNLTKITEIPSEELVEEISDEKATVKIVDIAGNEYQRGKSIFVPSSNKSVNAIWNKTNNLQENPNDVRVNLEIVSGLKDLGLSYKIYSSVNPGEKLSREGKAEIIRPNKDSGDGTASIPLNGLSHGMKTIEVIATAKDYSNKFYMQVGIVRSLNSEYINDSKVGQWFSFEDTEYNKNLRGYVLGKAKTICGYANLNGELSAKFLSSVPGLELKVEGKVVKVIASENKVYRNVSVRVTNDAGERIDFDPITLYCDDVGPTIKISRPTEYEWVKNRVVIQGSVEDTLGVANAEYSVDGGVTWKSFGSGNGRLSMQLWADETVTNREDGLIEVNIRTTDIVGNSSYFVTSVHKDTVAPEVTVVVPCVEEIVNGKNQVAFLVKDNGAIENVSYVNVNTGLKTQIADASMFVTFVGTKEMPISNSMRFDFTDKAGNVTSKKAWEFVVDNKSDLPVATVQLPTDNEVITKDFVVSGVVLDDDGPSKVYYKIDNGKFNEIQGEGYSFKVDIPLNAMTDNEHSVTVYGIDTNGVKGPEFVRKFRVSLAEPVGQMTEPKIEETQSELTTLRGTAFDKNGISKVEISLDNGNSYNLAVGKENWSYTFDTRVLPDGTHVVFLRTTDGYGIESIYSSLINIDNTKPELSLELPLDDSKTTGPIFFSGFTIDNIGLTDLYISVTSLDGKYVPAKLSKIDLTPDKIITTSVDLTSLENGRYNVQLTGKDAAGNESSVSRNITLNKRTGEADVNIYYPLNGERKAGNFNVYGEVQTSRKVESVSLIVNDQIIETVELSKTGFFKFALTPELLKEGTQKYKIRASLEGNMTVESITQTVEYEPYGPWITIDNFTYGDFAVERPYLKGVAGYSIAQEEIDASKAKGATKEQKEALESKTLSYIDISFDNGKTFTRISDKKNWKYRIENEDMPEGYHFLLIRAIMKNGEVAINRCIVQIDKTAPFVKMIAPSIGGKYNQELEFSGLASDAVGLNSVTLALRKGDKAGYEVPAFIQGLYLDASVWGSTLFSFGAGLSFFDDNVKLQIQYGQFTQAQREIFSKTTLRYGGNVFGMKLLANIAYIPFRSFLGPDWDWLSMGIALGANFSFFSETASGKPQMLSALLAQIEFPRVTLKKAKCFRTFSLYTEFQLWFIPTDVSVSTGSVKNMIFQFSEGIRINIF